MTMNKMMMIAAVVLALVIQSSALATRVVGGPGSKNFLVTNGVRDGRSDAFRPVSLLHPSRGNNLSARLRYKNVDEDAEANTKQFQRRLQTWWGSLKSRRQRGEQQSVDLYLEFLDRRYHRLNDDDEPPKKTEKKKKSVLDWVGEKPVSDTQQDALYVLGVAKLASKQLLQKHKPHILPEEQDNNSGVVIDAEVRPAKPLNPLTVGSVLVRALIRSFGHVLVRTPLTLFRLGGGKGTVMLGLSMLTASFLLLRPVVAAMIRET